MIVTKIILPQRREVSASSGCHSKTPQIRQLKQQTFITHGWKSMIKVLAWSAWLGPFSWLCPRRAERRFVSFFFSMALILSCGLHLHDLISSQGPNDKHYHTRIRASTCELEEDIHIFSKEDVKKDHLWVSNVLRMPLRCRMYSELEPTGKNWTNISVKVREKLRVGPWLGAMQPEHRDAPPTLAPWDSMGEADLAAVGSGIQFSHMFHVESPVGHPNGVFKWVVRYLGPDPMGERARLEA